MGRIDNKRLAFADNVSFACGDCFPIGFSHPDTICFTSSIVLTGCVPVCDGVSVDDTGPLSGSVPFAIRDLVKPGFSFDTCCFANALGAEPAKKKTATARTCESAA